MKQNDPTRCGAVHHFGVGRGLAFIAAGLLLGVSGCAADDGSGSTSASHELGVAPEQLQLGPACGRSPDGAYERIPLGTLGGYRSAAFGLNDRAQVVGRADIVDGSQRAFVWENGTMTDLGVLPGDTRSAAHAINNRGDIVGVSETDFEGTADAVLWSGGQVHILPPLSGDLDARPYAINDRGEIVGVSLRRDEFGSTIARAVIWRDLAPSALDGDMASGINASGAIVGTSGAPEYGPVLWTAAGERSLAPLLEARGLNNVGGVIGLVAPSWVPSAAIWWAGRVIDLGVPGSVGTGINDRFQAVGIKDIMTGFGTPFVWSGGNTIELPVPFIGGDAVAINNSGEVAGSDADQAVLWTCAKVRAARQP